MTCRVFYKQRDNHFFQSSVFSVVLAVIRAPFLVAEAFIFSCITYFWIGVHTTFNIA